MKDENENENENEINTDNNSNNIININNINTDGVDKKKNISYKKDLWMYFDSIKNKFFYDRTKAKSLLYIISQKNDLEYEYSQNLKNLYEQYKIEFDNANKKNISNNVYNETSLSLAINNFIDKIKYESELYSNHSKDILENIIKPLEDYIVKQCEKTYDLMNNMESYEKEYKIVNTLVEQKQVSFHHGGKAVETAMHKLELMKNKINDEEDFIDVHQNIFTLDDEDNEKEMLEKLTEIVENNKVSAKQLQIEYEDYIIKANNEREKYISLSENVYDEIQNLDEGFINMMKNQLNTMIGKELDLLENIKKRTMKLLDYLNEINVDNDIKKFIESKLVKFSPPKPFEYIEYYPDIVIRNMKGTGEIVQNKIGFKILENLKNIFKFEKIKVDKTEEENSNFINDTVNDIWDGNNYNQKKLDLLLKEHIYRFRFLRMLNQYRVEGIFILKNIAFQNFCMALSSLLDNAIKEEDYECIKLCMILSQTFYLEGRKKILLQSGIALNTIWQKKDFWVKIIEYSISEEINNAKGYMIFLEENGNAREKRAESSIISTLITYSFNMKLFGYSEKESKIVIDELIKKYKIDGTMVSASIVSMNDMNDIKEDIINKSVENIVDDKNINDNDKDNDLNQNNIDKNLNGNDKDNNLNHNNNTDKSLNGNDKDNNLNQNNTIDEKKEDNNNIINIENINKQ